MLRSHEMGVAFVRNYEEVVMTFFTLTLSALFKSRQYLCWITFHWLLRSASFSSPSLGTIGEIHYMAHDKLIRTIVRVTSQPAHV